MVALIVLDHELAPGWAARNGLAGDDLAALAAHEQVLAEVQLAVEAANQRLARIEQVKRFEILPVEWTAESEELTPTLKLRRRIIHAKYAERIEACTRADKPARDHPLPSRGGRGRSSRHRARRRPPVPGPRWGA